VKQTCGLFSFEENLHAINRRPHAVRVCSTLSVGFECFMVSGFWVPLPITSIQTCSESFIANHWQPCKHWFFGNMTKGH
jgi:hypothetical protein